MPIDRETVRRILLNIMKLIKMKEGRREEERRLYMAEFITFFH